MQPVFAKEEHFAHSYELVLAAISVCNFCHSALYLNNNSLSGDVPTWLQVATINTLWLDFNCFNNCAYLRASQCPLPTDPTQVGALVDLYHATGQLFMSCLLLHASFQQVK
jgi:hypothetical protein